MDTFQTYIDRDPNNGNALRAGSQTEGYIYFSCPKSGARVTNLTCEGADVTLGATTSQSSTFTTTITAGTLDDVLSSGARKITWTLTYTLGNAVITVKNYTMVYAPYLTPVVAATRWASNIRTSSLSWISGIHRMREDPSYPTSYYPRYDATLGKRLIPLLETVTLPGSTTAHEWAWDWLTPDSLTVKGQTIGRSATYWHNIGEAGEGGGEKGASARSAIGTLIVDSSRYTNVSQIPNLTSGFLASQVQASGDGNDGNTHQAFYWYIGDFSNLGTGVGGTGEITGDYGRVEWKRTPNSVLAGDQNPVLGNDSTDDRDSDDHKDTLPTAERILKADGPITGLADWNAGEASAVNYVFGSHAYTYSAKWQQTAWVWNRAWTNRSFNANWTFLDCYRYDKSALRNAVQAEINKALNSAWYTTSTWNAYASALDAAVTMLGRPDYPYVSDNYAQGTSDIQNVILDLQTAASNLELPASRATGTAYAAHYSTRAQANGTYNCVKTQETKQYQIGDKVWATPEDITGYTYSDYYTPVSTQTVPNPPGTTEGTPAPIEFTDQSFYKWVFYYDPIQYTVTYMPSGGMFNGTAAPSTEQVYFDDPYTVGTHVGGGTDQNPTAAPAYTGHNFTGWSFVDMDGRQLPYAHGASYGAWDQPSSSQVFLAQWTPYTYTIRFAPDSTTESGTAQTLSSSAAYDDPITLPVGTGNYAYSRTGYTLTGWSFTDGGAQQYVLGAQIDKFGDLAEAYAAGITDTSRVETVNGVKTLRDGQTITLYPAWTVNHYELTFDNEIVFTRDMAGVAAQSGAANVALDDSTGTVSFDSTGANALLTPSARIPVKARHSYKITYTTNAADPKLRLALYADTTSSEADSEENVASGTVYVADGGFPYIALQFGASSAQEGVTYNNIRVQDITNPVEAGKSPARLVADDVNTPVPGRVWKAYDSQYSDLPVMTRTGYTFNGWFAGRNAYGNGSGVQVLENNAGHTMPASAKQLWSKWTANPYTVQFNPDGGYFAEPAGGFTTGTSQTAAQSKVVTYGEAFPRQED